MEDYVNNSFKRERINIAWSHVMLFALTRPDFIRRTCNSVKQHTRKYQQPSKQHWCRRY